MNRIVRNLLNHQNSSKMAQAAFPLLQAKLDFELVLKVLIVNRAPAEKTATCILTYGTVIFVVRIQLFKRLIAKHGSIQKQRKR